MSPDASSRPEPSRREPLSAPAPTASVLSEAPTLVAAGLGFAVVQLDVTIVNVALPAIGDALRSGVAGLQWVVDAYTLAFASFLLTAGALGDLYGARRVFVVGFAVFTATSLACAAAPSLPLLVAARALQGLGAALLIPCSLALLNRAYADRATRAKAVGLWGAAGGIASAAGPLAGGFLVAALGWRSIFYVNLPLGIAGILLALRFVREAPPRADRRIDWPGQAAGTVALAALVAALIEEPALGWRSPVVIALVVGAVAAAVGFIWIEARAARPMLPLSLFRRPAFAGSTAIGFIVSFAFYGLIFVLSLYFQRVRGFSAPATGLAFLPMMAIVAVSSPLSGRVGARVGLRLPIVVGLLLALAGVLALLVIGETTPYGALVAPMLAVGGGISFVVPAMTSAIIAAVGEAQFGIASGALNASRQTGAAAGVAVFGSLVAQGPGAAGAVDFAGFLAGLRLALAAAAVLIIAGSIVGQRFIRPEARR